MAETAEQVAATPEDELWAQVEQDRATRAASGSDNEPQEANADDPLASLPEPTRKLIQGLDEQVRKSNEQLAILDRKFGTANGVIGNLKQRLDESHAKLKEVEPIISAAETARRAAAESAAREREQRRIEVREAVSDISPEFAEFVEMAVDDVRVKPAQEAQAPAVNPDKEELEEAKLLLAMSQKVPGWWSTRELPEFKKWVSEQPAEFREMAENTRDVGDLASVFAGFDDHKKAAAQISQVENERKERLARGSSIQGRGSSVGNIDLSVDAAWEKVKKDRAKRAYT